MEDVVLRDCNSWLSERFRLAAAFVFGLAAAAAAGLRFVTAVFFAGRPRADGLLSLKEAAAPSSSDSSFTEASFELLFLVRAARPRVEARGLAATLSRCVLSYSGSSLASRLLRRYPEGSKAPFFSVLGAIPLLELVERLVLR